MAGGDYNTRAGRNRPQSRPTPALRAQSVRAVRYHGGVEDTVSVRCPYCREWVELYVDPDTTGVIVEDCAVCCRPWSVTIDRSGAKLRVQVARAQ